jgi:hypothetical protein
MLGSPAARLSCGKSLSPSALPLRERKLLLWGDQRASQTLLQSINIPARGANVDQDSWDQNRHPLHSFQSVDTLYDSRNPGSHASVGTRTASSMSCARMDLTNSFTADSPATFSSSSIHASSCFDDPGPEPAPESSGGSTSTCVCARSLIVTVRSKWGNCGGTFLPLCLDSHVPQSPPGPRW